MPSFLKTKQDNSGFGDFQDSKTSSNVFAGGLVNLNSLAGDNKNQPNNNNNNNSSNYNPFSGSQNTNSNTNNNPFGGAPSSGGFSSGGGFGQ